MRFRNWLAIFFVGAVGILPTCVAEGAASTQPTVENETVWPSAVTEASVAYRLLPDPKEQTPGNAVLLYLMSRRFWPDQQTTDDVLSPEKGRFDYLGTPIDRFPRMDAQRLLDVYSQTLSYVDAAARREKAVWPAVWQESEVHGSAYVYLDDLRHAANLLKFRARYEVSQENWAATAYTVQTGLSMARQVGSEPTLIHAVTASQLGGAAMSGGVWEWITHRDSPNLYWALTDLPRSFVDLEQIRRWELDGPPRFGNSALLSQAIGGNLAQDKWGQVIREAIGVVQQSKPPYKQNAADVENQAKAMVTAALPRAKQYLLGKGVGQQEIDSMSPEQVVGSYLVQEYDGVVRGVWMYWSLPYWQAREQMLRRWEELSVDQPPLSENPLIVAYATDGTGKPGVLRMRRAIALFDQRIATARMVEALRDYAARHGGLPPDSLDQVTDLPLPIDPMTGKGFVYKAMGQVAELEFAPEAAQSANGFRIVLTFGK
jgi:hypothetical protein